MNFAESKESLIIKSKITNAVLGEDESFLKTVNSERFALSGDCIVYTNCCRKDTLMESVLLNSNKMLGAAFGDIAGSIYEWNNIKYKLTADQLLNERCKVTDDTIMTIAVADGIRNAFSAIQGDWLDNINAENLIYKEI